MTQAYASIAGAARHFGVGREVITGWIREGKLEVFLFGIRTKRVELAAVAALARAKAEPKDVDVRAIALRSLR